MKKLAVATIIAVATTLVGHRIMSNALRSAMIDKEIAAKTMAEFSAIDQAHAAIEEMLRDGLYEDKSVADIERDFHSLIMLYAAK